MPNVFSRKKRIQNDAYVLKTSYQKEDLRFNQRDLRKYLIQLYVC